MVGSAVFRGEEGLGDGSVDEVSGSVCVGGNGRSRIYLEESSQDGARMLRHSRIRLASQGVSLRL